MRFVSLLLLNFLAFGSGFIAGPPFVIRETRAVCSAVNNGDVDASVGATVDVDVDVGVDVDVPCSNEDEENTGHMPVPVLFYPGKLNRLIPQEFYSDFISKLRKHREVYVANDSSDIDEDFMKGIVNGTGVCLVSHSTSANHVLDLCKTIDEGFVEHIVLIDPIEHLFFKNDFPMVKLDLSEILENAEEFEQTISEFIEANKFDLLRKSLFGKKDANDKKLNSKVLVLNSRLSNRWKVFPPIPPVSKYSLNLKHIRNKEIRVIEDYGHFDILDAPWATMMYNTVARGSVSRDTENIEAYHAILVDYINKELSS